jgi:L-aspartate oxidase
VFAACRAAGIDPTREPIPVAPAAHYHMGGILTDARGRSTVDGLWACGEVASTGAHGANRLASNSLLEAVVFGARVAADIASSPSRQPKSLDTFAGEETTPQGSGDERAEQKLRLAMTAGAGVIRDEDSLRNALATIGDLEQTSGGDRRLANMLIVAKLIAAAALARKESRGAHFRSDYPTPDARLAKRSFLTLTQAEDIVRRARETPLPASGRRSVLGSTALNA